MRRIRKVFLLAVMVCLILNASVLFAAQADVKLGGVILLQPDDILKTRISGAGELAGYLKKVEEAVRDAFKAAEDLKPTTFAVYLAVKPQYKARYWFLSSEYKIPAPVDRDFSDRFQKIRPLAVNMGPIALVLHFTVNGGGKPLFSVKETMPLPDEWTAVIKGSKDPVLVPDGILAAIWPEPAGSSPSLLTPPEGFVLQRLDVTRGMIFKPIGWFYDWGGDRSSIVWTLSREDIKKTGRYDTGMRIQYFYKPKDQSAKSTAEHFISRKKQEARKIFRECPPETRDELVCICLETLERTATPLGNVDYRIRYSIFWSEKQNTLIFTTFGTPEPEWEKYRLVADTMASFVLYGEDDGTKKPAAK